MKLIVGLGNPGKEYENTRHNIGFSILDNYIQKNNIELNKKKFNSIYAECFIENEKVILLKPMEYINCSGEAVKKIVKFYKINIEDILIIYDDLDIEIGKFKLKPKGTDAGHNGIKSIINNLKTNEIKRMKIGIGKDNSIDGKEYVLSKFKTNEIKKLEKIKKMSEKIIEDFIKLDFLLVMNKYN